ncbi:MAG TPA: histidine phosphatase family protein, partial [Firmicutes bacterium]|nr:histidine phosphatase family protein [Bacillota bacterium]
MDLLVIRHGQSEADVLNIIEGRADFPLTDRGHAQAEEMAKWVNDHYKITSIVCSALLRARQTAEHLSQATGVSGVYDDDLMEWQNGLIAGLTRAE